MSWASIVRMLTALLGQITLIARGFLSDLFPVDRGSHHHLPFTAPSLPPSPVPFLTALCKNNCSGKGKCEQGLCKCKPKYWKDDCSELSCTNNCTGSNGQCFNGTCRCQPKYEGADCAERT